MRTASLNNIDIKTFRKDTTKLKTITFYGKYLMTKHIVYVNASIIAGIIAAMAISSILPTTNSVWASSTESLTQKKDVRCDDGMHTQSYCDGYNLGISDCEDGHKSRMHDKSHTKNWRDGYINGWRESGCSG